MCKIAVIPNVKTKKVKKTWEFVETLAPILSHHDNQGFGYMGISSKGNLFGERWVDNKQAFKTPDTNKLEKKLIDKFKGALGGSIAHNSFGKIQRSDLTAICIHARMATSKVNLSNTHPFITEERVAGLIHNGVVDTDNLELKTSTCDSEGILNAYMQHGVNADPDHIMDLVTTLDGWYACGVIAKHEKNWYLDVFKDDHANLSANYIKELDTLVFCTDPAMVAKACKKLGWTVLASMDVSDNSFMRFNAITGKLIAVRRFQEEEEQESNRKIDVKTIIIPGDHPCRQD